MSGKAERIEWDAEAYDKLSDPQYRWGTKLLQSIELRGDEAVMDAGCGSGRLTEDLLARLPRGRVIAVDSSENMVQTARKRLQGYGDRVSLLCVDLTELPMVGELDGIFSNAVFHWLPDHAALFRTLLRALKPGGWLVAQCGGEGNLARLRGRLHELMEREPYAKYLKGWNDGAHYEGATVTRTRLEAAGFVVSECRLHPDPVQFPDADSMVLFVRKVNAHRFVSRLPQELEDTFVRQAAEQAALDKPPFVLDYVRLTMRARRGD